MSDTWQYLGEDETGPIPDEWAWERLRLRRDALLAASDSRVGPDAPGDVDAWRTYRQALRDLPANTTDPRTAVWPIAPESDTRDPNRATLETQAAQALAANRLFIADANVTTAEAVAQTKALSRQMNGVIRLLLNELDGTD